MIEITDGNGEEESLNEDSEEYRQKVRELNDAFRTTFSGGQVLVTSGVQALGEKTIHEICQKVQTFNEFTEDNDPWKEHDFGVIELNGMIFNWKIDCYDLDRQYLSPDKTNPAVTIRVLTIMRKEEY
jgi:uncharacterized protein DUF3768